MKKKRLIKESESIKLWDIPMQININFQTYEDMLTNNGEIDQHNPENFPVYEFEKQRDNPEWGLQQ